MGRIPSKIKELMEYVYPVGSIFEWAPAAYSNVDLSTAEKVAAYLGGRWEAYGAGLVTVGIQAGDPDFGKAGKTGGEKAHSLTEPEGPWHTHTYRRAPLGWSDVQVGEAVFYDDAKTAQAIDGETSAAGQGVAHNNMQPYVVVYRYRRIK